MRNYIGPGDTVEVVAPGEVSSGDGVLVDHLFGIAVKDSDTGDEVEIKTTGVFELPKVSAQAWAVGEAIYWDDDNSRCTTVDTGRHIGAALAIAANPTATGIVRLNGFLTDEPYSG